MTYKYIRPASGRTRDDGGQSQTSGLRESRYIDVATTIGYKKAIDEYQVIQMFCQGKVKGRTMPHHVHDRYLHKSTHFCRATSRTYHYETQDPRTVSASPGACEHSREILDVWNPLRVGTDRGMSQI